MGWQRDGHMDHEGWVVGYVLCDGCEPGSRLYRELQYAPMSAGEILDNRDIGPGVIKRIGAGCDCGWRSRHIEPLYPVEWMPHIVLANERDEDRAQALWDEHLDLEHLDLERRTKTSRELVEHLFRRIEDRKEFAYEVGFGSQSRDLLVKAALALWPDATRDKIGTRLAEADHRHFSKSARRRA